MLTDCMYCHKDYKPNITNHYCDDCVVICPTCNELKGLWCFPFDYDSETYKNWKNRGANGILPKDGHTKTCGSCLEKSAPVEALRKTLAKLKPGQLELLLGSQKKT